MKRWKTPYNRYLYWFGGIVILMACFAILGGLFAEELYKTERAQARIYENSVTPLGELKLKQIGYDIVDKVNEKGNSTKTIGYLILGTAGLIIVGMGTVVGAINANAEEIRKSREK